jgi:hypothetical protein
MAQDNGTGAGLNWPALVGKSPYTYQSAMKYIVTTHSWRTPAGHLVELRKGYNDVRYSTSQCAKWLRITLASADSIMYIERSGARTYCCGAAGRSNCTNILGTGVVGTWTFGDKAGAKTQYMNN